MNKELFFKRWILPPGILEQLRKMPLSKGERTLLKKNINLRNLHKDVSRCFILATGPSINDENLLQLKDELCISVSNFFVHPHYSLISPKYHIFAATHPPITNEQFGRWVQEGINKSGVNTEFFVSASDKTCIDNYVDFKISNVNYYATGGGYPIDFCKKLPRVCTVVHLAIYLAIYFGIKEIYLLGVDHNWIMDYGNSHHFYEENENLLNKQGYDEWTSSDIGNQFEEYAKLWSVYRDVKNNNKNVNIFNLTKNSLLDLFPRKILDDLKQTPER